MDYENMTVAELKDLLRDAGLPVSGKKADLVARLQETTDASEDLEDVEDVIEEEMDVDDDEFDIVSESGHLGDALGQGWWTCGCCESPFKKMSGRRKK